MTTEYWLQKKTIGGWSMVTWYNDLQQAQENYQRALDNGMSGYSWRLVEVNELEVSMLNDVVPVEAPVINLPPARVGETFTVINNTDNPVKLNAWGGVQTIVEPKQSWAKLVERAWGQSLNPEQQADVNNAWSNFKTCNTVSAKSEHGLTGSVWVVHHAQKIKKRIAASEVDSYLAQGYVKAGPRTQFDAD